jgi:hypothetical protein
MIEGAAMRNEAVSKEKTMAQHRLTISRSAAERVTGKLRSWYDGLPAEERRTLAYLLTEDTKGYSAERWVETGEAPPHFDQAFPTLLLNIQELARRPDGDDIGRAGDDVAVTRTNSE